MTDELQKKVEQAVRLIKLAGADGTVTDASNDPRYKCSSPKGNIKEE